MNINGLKKYVLNTFSNLYLIQENINYIYLEDI